MKFSIITPSFNHAEFIEDTILSVLSQSYNNFEHIIIDGGSRDNTVEILKKHKHLKWISEPDNGQTSAINKGFRLATGDIFAWLNSDDYYDKDIFIRISDYFVQHPECYFLYGDISYVDKNKNFMFSVTGGNMSYSNLLKNPDLVRQPSCFWRKEIFDIIGPLDENLHLVMDYEYFLRIGKKYNFHYLPYNLSYFRYYPDNKTLSMANKQHYELKKIMNDNVKFYSYLLKKRLYHYRQSVNKLISGK
jgi:glycosyltransferase involved in cell wall biosynthesis